VKPKYFNVDSQNTCPDFLSPLATPSDAQQPFSFTQKDSLKESQTDSSYTLHDAPSFPPQPTRLPQLTPKPRPQLAQHTHHPQPYKTPSRTPKAVPQHERADSEVERHEQSIDKYARYNNRRTQMASNEKSGRC